MVLVAPAPLIVRPLPTTQTASAKVPALILMVSPERALVDDIWID